ncbi:type III secretion system cytoplasmic ring protein SctQ [Duganella sp.]|uniref:type III secretion system cytoplasmic ring protein SctQ n=1 Tax=Duganella sp. TaxID=1904440 RepID=UPI0031D6FA3E
MPRESNTIYPLHTRLPALAPALARLTRLLFDRRSALLAEHLGWTALPTPPSQAASAHLARLRLNSEHGAIDCLFALPPYPALESAALAPSAPWRAALADILLQPWLQRWQQLGLPALSVTALTPLDDHARHTPPPGLGLPALPVAAPPPLDDDAQHATPPCLGLRPRSVAALSPLGQEVQHALPPGLGVQLRAAGAPSPDGAILIITGIDSPLLDALEAVPRPQLDLPAWLGTLPLAGAAVLGARRCTPALLASLRRGDVLLGWRGGVRDSTTLSGITLRWGAPQGLHYRAAAAIAGNTITLDSFPTLSLEPDTMEPDTARHDNATDVAALELPITLEIATMAMPLQQLGALQPGQVLALPLALADARVRMVACGQVIGHGQLIVVGEQLGFQLDMMVHGDDADA